MTDRLRPFLTVAVPALVVLGIVLHAVWGDDGWVERNRLRSELGAATDELATLERANQKALRDLSLLERDPLVLEREVADALGRAESGTVLVEFAAPADER